jgi:serine/threonine protein kinase/Flp pilus assembly protein TadD
MVCATCGEKLPDPTAGCSNCAATQSLTEAADARKAAVVSAPKGIAGYKIIRELGAGGMGTVYEAYEEKMQRRVALKVLSRHFAPSQKAPDRFAREAWIGGKLNHPNLVKIYERGGWEDLNYYSMEFVDGGSLADVVRRLKNDGRDEKLGLEFGSREYIHWAISQVIAAARGLDYAHRQGVLHRDIKPMNILISREPATIKIADFGLAVDTEITRLTTDGTVFGTLAYVAPEQVLGRQDRIDARTDIYALGVTLFELLTLELPYKGSTQQLYMDAVLKSEARRPSRINDRVSRDLEIVIRKALEKNPRDRYRSAAEMADDLENVLHFRPIAARPSGIPRRLLKWTRRRPIHAALIGALVLGIPTIGVLTQRAVKQRALLDQVRVQELWSEIRWFWQRGRYHEILARTTTVLDLDSRSARALRDRSMALTYLSLSAAKPAEAAALRERALRDCSRLIELRPGESWPHSNHAWALSQFGQQEAALRAGALARQHRSDPPADDDLYVDALLSFNSGDFAEVVNVTTDLLARRPDRRDVRATRGDAYERLDQVNKAINDYLIVIALAPDEILNHLVLGRLYTKAGSLNEGLAHLRQARQLDPENAYAPQSLSWTLFELGKAAAAEGEIGEASTRFEEGVAAARTSLGLNPTLPWAHVNLGVNLIHLSHLREQPNRDTLAEALGHFAEARSLAQATPDKTDAEAFGAALVNECDVLIQLRDLEEALAQCRMVIDAEPENPTGYYNLAGAYALMGRTEEAFAALEKDFELGDRDHLYLASDRWFESLRGDARFIGLIERMKSE